MQAHQIESPRLSEDVRELLGLLAGYRWRLGAEVLLRFLLRGLIVGALLLAALSTLDWLVELGLQSTWLWAALVLPVVAALGQALAAWPSPRETARTADRRLRLEERLGTAVELGSARGARANGRFDRVQLRDAIARLYAAPRTWPSIARGARRELILTLAVSLLAAFSLVLPNLPRPRFAPQVKEPAMGELVGVADDRPLSREAAPLAPQDSAAVAEQTAERDLAPRVSQAQAEQQALDRLAQALGSVSPGKGAADAIQRGEFGTARDQLATLGEEADQLSDAAKKQLAQALQSAASATSATDRQLAERERQAASALSRTSYADQRAALRQLADQVERSGARSLPAADLARAAGRLQQQQQQGVPNRQGPGRDAQAASASGIQAQQATDGNAGPGGQSPLGGTASEQGGPGVGTGSTDGVGDPAGRLATSGQRVDVPLKLGAGAGQRPRDGTEDQVGSNPGVASRSAIEAARTQQTGQVSPEQNLVPGDQQPVVRGYFR